MTAQAPSNETVDEMQLGNEFVTIYVGSEKREFIVHRNAICQSSDYFAKAFESPFQEGQTGTMFLPDDNPIAFSIFVTWLYRRVIPTGSTTSHLHNLADVYIFADKICDGVLKDKVMDEIQDLAWRFLLIDPLFSQTFLSKIFDNTDGQGLGKFCMWVLAFEYLDRDDNAEILTNNTRLKIVWEISKDHFEALQLFQERVLIQASWTGEWWDPRQRKHDETKYCKFHCHEKDFDCGATKTELKEELAFIDDLDMSEES